VRTLHNGYVIDSTPHGADIFDGDDPDASDSIYVLTITSDTAQTEADVIAEAKVWVDIARALEAMLLTINAFETLDGTLTLTGVIDQAMNLLYVLKNEIGSRYDTNPLLARLDVIFTSCGWDRQGLRWSASHYDTEDVFVVEFKNEERTEWEPT
jgi:hypothetical protein